MKKLIYILAFLPLPLLGQEFDGVTTNIQKECQDIDSGSYSVDEHEMVGRSTEGGYLSLYKDELGLRKAELGYYGEMGKHISWYYFRNDTCIYIHEQDFDYNQPIYVQEGWGIKNVKESNIYLHKNEIILWEDAGHKQSDSLLLSEKNIEIINAVTEILEIE